MEKKKINLSSFSFQEIIDKMNKPKLENKVGFFRLLAVTQKAWLWVRDSLKAILNWESHPWMRKIIISLINETSKWTPLSESLAMHPEFFLTDEVALIKSSETMWNMPEVLQNLSDELENFQQLLWKVKSALTYPTTIIVFAIIAIIILLIYVIPTMVTMFPDEDTLPAITLFMLRLSDFMQNNWYYVFASVVSLVITYNLLYKYFMPFKIWVDKAILKAPIIWSVAKKFNLYRFSKLLWDFYNAWVSPVESLKQISSILQNYHYKMKTLNVKNDLELWLWFVESMEWSWLFDPILVQIIWIWEDTWNVWDVLWKMADFYREQLDTEIEWLMKLIEPILMWFVAVVVWVIVASIFLPMWDLIWTIA